MSDDLKYLTRQLEQATARRCPAEDPMDPETAALRAGWLALGELLEAGQSPGGPPQLPVPRATARRRKHWLPAAVAALAACLLIGATLAWFAWGTKQTTIPSPGSSEVAVKVPPREPAAPDPSASDEIAWDDTLDQAIESAGRAIVQAEQDQLAWTSAPAGVQYRIESLKNEIDKEPL